MIFTSRQIVWTPMFRRESLAIALDREFAEVCMTHQEQDMQRFIEGVWSFMGDTPSVVPSTFLDMYQGILPKGFYAGHDGVWLTLAIGASATRPLTYHGHNEDRHAADRL